MKLTDAEIVNKFAIFLETKTGGTFPFIRRDAFIAGYRTAEAEIRAQVRAEVLENLRTQYINGGKGMADWLESEWEEKKD